MTADNNAYVDTAFFTQNYAGNDFQLFVIRYVTYKLKMATIFKVIFYLFSLLNGKLFMSVWDRGSTVVKLLRYKSECCLFDPRLCHWNS